MSDLALLDRLPAVSLKTAARYMHLMPQFSHLYDYPLADGRVARLGHVLEPHPIHNSSNCPVVTARFGWWDVADISRARQRIQIGEDHNTIESRNELTRLTLCRRIAALKSDSSKDASSVGRVCIPGVSFASDLCYEQWTDPLPDKEGGLIEKRLEFGCWDRWLADPRNEVLVTVDHAGPVIAKRSDNTLELRLFGHGLYWKARPYDTRAGQAAVYGIKSRKAEFASPKYEYYFKDVIDHDVSASYGSKYMMRSICHADLLEIALVCSPANYNRRVRLSA